MSLFRKSLRLILGGTTLLCAGMVLARMDAIAMLGLPQQNEWRRIERVERLVHGTLLLLGLTLMASVAFGTSGVGRNETYWVWITTAQMIVVLAGISAKFWLLPVWRRKLAMRTQDAAVRRLRELGIKTE